jgi:hypothetical protein
MPSPGLRRADARARPPIERCRPSPSEGVAEVSSPIEVSERDAKPLAASNEDGRRQPEPGAQRERPLDEREPANTAWVSLASLFAALWTVAFISCVFWQAGVLASRAMDGASRASSGSQAPRTPAKELSPSTRVDDRADSSSVAAAEVATRAVTPVEAAPASLALVAVEPALTAPRASSIAAFEASAEASEKVIPVGLETALDPTERTLVLGEAPPPDYPRTECDDVFVYIVTLAEGSPQSSAASLGLGSKGAARFRQPGERIGTWTVLAITDDWTGLEPDVWLEKDGVVCQAQLAGNPARLHSALKPAPPRRVRPRRKAPRQR